MRRPARPFPVRRALVLLLGAALVGIGVALALVWTRGESDGGVPTAGTELLRNDSGQNAKYSGIGQLKAASTCTAFLLETPAQSAPAYALTNGHCFDLNAYATRLGEESDGAITFNHFVDTAGSAVKVRIARVAWSSMKGVDLAVVRLESTLAALEARGVQPLRLASVPDAGTHVESVGVPVAQIPAAEQFLRRSSCSAGERVPRLVEGPWSWYDVIPFDCKGIVQGSSGSPLLDATSGDVVGVINTTTFLGERLTPCYPGRPCELVGDDLTARSDTSYAIRSSPRRSPRRRADTCSVSSPGRTLRRARRGNRRRRRRRSSATSTRHPRSGRSRFRFTRARKMRASSRSSTSPSRPCSSSRQERPTRPGALIQRDMCHIGASQCILPLQTFQPASAFVPGTRRVTRPSRPGSASSSASDSAPPES